MKFKEYLKVCLAVMLLTAVYACNETADQKKYAGTAFDTSTVDTTKFNAEYILYDSVKINGVLPLDSKYADFVKIIGKPDSVYNAGPNDDCAMFMVPYQEAYSKGNMFYLLNDTAKFQNIDFRKRPDLEIKTPAITLNGKTTLQDIKKLFPRAVRDIRSLEDQGMSLRMISLGATKESIEEYWVLCFEGDKLVIAEMFSPC